MPSAIGIDFGTSNSTVGYSGTDGPRLIALEGIRTAIPRAVFFDFEESHTLFGGEAVAAYTNQHHGRLLRALKSILGSSLIYDKTKLDRRQVSFLDIIGEFLAHLKAKAEANLQTDIDSVVLGRPVWFVDNDPEADPHAQQQLEQAARTQGFKHICFQYEPVAAALDYEQGVQQEELTLIIDIGGGTSDFSIVRVSPDRRKAEDRKSDILASTGVHVGGTDLDKRLSLRQIMPLLGYNTSQRARAELNLPASVYFDLATWHRIAFLYNHKTTMALKEMHRLSAQPGLVDRLMKIVEERNGHRLAGDMEAGKIGLSHQASVPLKLDYVESGLNVLLQKDIFEEATEQERSKIVQGIGECITQAGIASTQIDTVFLTGGTTAIPSIYHACSNAVPNARIVEGDKLGSVGMGLAIDSAIKFGCSFNEHHQKR
jgi:hypothetical chaperone protein